jgi:hypothetical protein
LAQQRPGGYGRGAGLRHGCPESSARDGLLFFCHIYLRNRQATSQLLNSHSITDAFRTQDQSSVNHRFQLM